MLAPLSIDASDTYLESSEVDHTVDIRVRFEDLIQGGSLGDVHIVKSRTLAANEFDTIHGLVRRVAEIINDDDLIISF